MRIRSITPNEPEGRHVTLGDGVYHFAPGPDGNTCEVTDKAHVARLLSIKEGYEAVGTAPAAATTTTAATNPDGGDRNGVTRKQLIDAYKAKFGKAPSPRASDATLMKKLAEA